MKTKEYQTAILHQSVSSHTGQKISTVIFDKKNSLNIDENMHIKSQLKKKNSINKYVYLPGLLARNMDCP